ncbi:hypothetical protein ARMGADRAFT_497064 [Armillaria gallica]|uniref:Uncharacterized protein n=1 Tax=Armillaria gallica TaxID=47427 RepID=A0A2H3E6E8_ARMGA|nr:hypothetical protein ARMGADRAFT_497064 [Armillaria gallica]
MNKSQSVRLARRACTRLSFTELAFDSITPSILIPRTVIDWNSLRFCHQLTTCDCTIQRYRRPYGVLLRVGRARDGTSGGVGICPVGSERSYRMCRSVQQ